MDTYKKLLPDIQQSHKLKEHIKNTNPESSQNFGIMVLIPKYRPLEEEFKNPTDISLEQEYELKVAMPCPKGCRNMSIIELLFCMLRSGK